MKRADEIKPGKLDWFTIGVFAILVILGWLNIFAVSFDQDAQQIIFDLSLNSGKQLLWIGFSVIAIIAIMIVDFRFYQSFAFGIYGGVMLLLVGVLVLGTVVAGSKSWIEIGFVRLQPAELAKFATALAVAKYFSKPNLRFDKIKNWAPMALLISLPAVLIVLQGDAGSALVFAAFVIVFYREGLPSAIVIAGIIAIALFVLTLLFGQVPTATGIIVLGALGILVNWRNNSDLVNLLGVGTLISLWFALVIGNIYGILGVLICIATVILINLRKNKSLAMVMTLAAFGVMVVTSVSYIVTDMLKPHQQNRIKAFINPEADPLGYGYNVTQSKIAIGSGGPWGQGFLEGTQTKFDFVPEQSTDFIFCTIGEEHGWIGSFILIGLFLTLLLRIIFLAERQKSKFSRIYGYGVAAILFFHFMVNIGMTIGLFPVIGIPLPFFSYGGSSLLSFSILLFVLIKLDAHRMQLLVR